MRGSRQAILAMTDHKPIENGTSELQPILEHDEEPSTSMDETCWTRLRLLCHNSLVRTATKNVGLICLW